MSDEPFGRQPKPVTVTVEGELIDTRYWAYELRRRAEFKGDMVGDMTIMHADTSKAEFKIYPQAVND